MGYQRSYLIVGYFTAPNPVSFHGASRSHQDTSITSNQSTIRYVGDPVGQGWVCCTLTCAARQRSGYHYHHSTVYVHRTYVCTCKYSTAFCISSPKFSPTLQDSVNTVICGIKLNIPVFPVLSCPVLSYFSHLQSQPTFTEHS